MDEPDTGSLLRARGRRRPALRHGLATTIVALLIFVSFPAYSLASGAVYRGTHAQGGTMEFELSEDGSKIIRFAFVGVRGSFPGPPSGLCTADLTVTFQPPTGIAISPPSQFSYESTYDSFHGSFTTTERAEGTYRLHEPGSFGCTTPTLQWTALTPDITPPDTAITAGPAGPTNVASPVFSFGSSESNSTFQ